MLRIVLFLTTILFFLLGCKKEKQPGIEEWHINPEALKYIKLQEGQYFIYKDSATGREDSVVVTKSRLYFENYTFDHVNLNNQWESKTVRREVFELEITLPANTASPKWLWGNVLLTKPEYGDVQHNNLIDHSAQMFNYPPTLNGCSCAGVLPSMTVEGKTYQNVVASLSGDNWRDYYWAPNVGLIKRTWKDVDGEKHSVTLLRHN
jgi:hypothetical protein